MHIFFNGTATETSAQTVKELLEEQGLSGKPVIVEWNQSALTASTHSTTKLSKGDQIECFVLGAGG